MKYLVMETHPAYAVVLDEEGRFLKAANLRYQVGDTVGHIVELRQPVKKARAPWRSMAGVAGLAACLCLVFFGYYQPNFIPYGTLRIQINPDVEMTVSRTERVLALEGLNADGEALIDGYDFAGKDREAAAEDLVERAIDLGYLSGGDTVSITVTSDDAGWRAREEAEAAAALEEKYGESIVIHLGGSQSAPERDDVQEVVVPVSPSAPEQSRPSGPSSPAQTSRPPSDDDTNGDPPADSTTGRDDAEDGTNGGGQADETDTEPGSDAGGVTDYEDGGRDPLIDGETDHDDRDDGDGSDAIHDGGDDWDDDQDDGPNDDQDDGPNDDQDDGLDDDQDDDQNDGPDDDQDDILDDDWGGWDDEDDDQNDGWDDQDDGNDDQDDDWDDD